MAQQTVQSHAVPGRLDLARVGRTHGRDVVGEMQTRLQEANLTVELDALDAEGRRRQTQLGQQPGRKIALEGDIVNRLHGRRASGAGKRQIGRCQPCVPVVRVHHVGMPIQEPPKADLGAEPAESGEAPGVIGPVITVGPEIEVTLPRKEVWRIDGQNSRAGGGTAGDKPRRPTEKIVDGCHPLR
jgi:hypothetical protein